MIIFRNNSTGTVTNGGTGNPAMGSTENWTVSTTTFPSLLPTGQSFHVADPVVPTEKMKVTGISGSGPYVWTVTRGDENTTTVTHSGGFTVQQVVTGAEFSNFTQTINAISYGAAGDARYVTDGVTTSGSATFTSATAAFTASDVGKLITVVRGAASEALLCTTISTFTNSTTVSLGVNAGNSASKCWTSIGTDNTTPLQNWLNDCVNLDVDGILPPGNYKVSGQLLVSGSTASIRGSAGLTSWIDGSHINKDGPSDSKLGAIIWIAGTDGSAVNLSENTVEGQMYVRSTTNPAVADLSWILVSDTQSAGTMQNGEIVQVEHTTLNGSTYTTWLREGLMSPAYLTGSTSKITPLNMLNDIRVENIGFQAAPVVGYYADQVQTSSTVIGSASGTSLIVASGSNFKVHDNIWVNTAPASGGSISGTSGEVKTITAIVSNTLTVARATSWNGSANESSQTNATAKIQAGNPVWRFPITPLRQTGVAFTKVFRPLVRGCYFSYCQEDGISMVDCINPVIDSNYIYDTADYGYGSPSNQDANGADTFNGYGISLSGATQWGTVTNNKGVRCKFLVCLTGSTSRGGQPRHHVITGNIAVDCFYGGFDCHPGGDDVEFSENIIDYTRESGSGQYDGIYFDGGRVRCINNKVRGAGRHGIYVTNTNLLRNGRFYIAGNDLVNIGFYDTENVNGRGILVNMGNASIATENVTIVNNNIRNSAGSSIMFIAPTSVTFNPHSVDVSHNTIQQTNSHGPAINLTNIQSGVVAKNNVRMDADADGIQINASTNVAVTGNQCECTTTSTAGHGILFQNTVSTCTLTGNKTTSFEYGIIADSTCDYICATGNNVHPSVNVTPFSISGAHSVAPSTANIIS